jgi:large subunit ribosomal protein L22
MGIAIAKATNARISLKHSLVLCNELKRRKLDKAKKFLEDLISQKTSINGKYYTNASKKFLEILNSAEANAKQKNLNLEKLFIKSIKANKGEKFIRPKSRFKFRGREAKSTNIEIVLEER